MVYDDFEYLFVLDSIDIGFGIILWYVSVESFV